MSSLKKVIKHISLMGIFVAANVFAADNVESPSRKNRITPIVQAVARVMPCVVNLSTEKIVDSYPGQSLGADAEGMFNFSPEELVIGKHKGYSLGSGSIIDESGLVVTNAHIVRQAIKIKVTFNDGQQYLAEVIASDELNDVALLKIVGLEEKVCPIQMGEPGDLLLGETVIVVGNPYGLGSSISSGVLSAIGRKITYQNQIIFGDILQTDAAVHPGNSGGPLINLNAEMIGINTAVLKGTQGIGFAVPLQRVENILAGWLVPERFRNVSVGMIPAVNRLKNGELAFFLRDVIKDSPAWKAGLQPEMRIWGVDGKPLTNIMTLCRKLWQMKAGESISLQLDSGKSVTVIAQSLLEANGSELAEIKLGIGVQILSEELARALGYPFKDGLIISNLPDNTTGLERGDVLLQLDETTINSLDDIARALRHKRSGDEVTAVVVKIYQRYGRFYLKKKIEKLKIK